MVVVDGLYYTVKGVAVVLDELLPQLLDGPVVLDLLLQQLGDLSFGRVLHDSIHRH